MEVIMKNIIVPILIVWTRGWLQNWVEAITPLLWFFKELYNIDLTLYIFQPYLNVESILGDCMDDIYDSWYWRK